MRNLLLAATAAMALAATPAYAGTILDFAQVGTASTITGTNNGGTSTTITGSNIAVTISAIDAALATPIPAFLTIAATSVGPATAGTPFDTQMFSGSFHITAGLGETGANYLSGTFTDAAFGAGPSLTISVGTAPGETISFTSSVIAASQLGAPEGMALSFSNVAPPVGITGTSLSSFTAAVTGDFSATAISTPEPASLALLGMGILGLGLVRGRRRNDVSGCAAA